MNNNELFTLETLGVFYTDAAEAGGMEWFTTISTWEETKHGPNT